VLGWIRLFRELVIAWNINEFRVLVGLRYAVYKYYRYLRQFLCDFGLPVTELLLRVAGSEPRCETIPAIVLAVDTGYEST
jgi:hypothetical protein